jgi:hypothetical protein
LKGRRVTRRVAARKNGFDDVVTDDVVALRYGDGEGMSAAGETGHERTFETAENCLSI